MKRSTNDSIVEAYTPAQKSKLTLFTAQQTILKVDSLHSTPPKRIRLQAIRADAVVVCLTKHHKASYNFDRVR